MTMLCTITLLVLINDLFVFWIGFRAGWKSRHERLRQRMRELGVLGNGQ